MAAKHITAAEAAVLESALPPGLTEDMRDMALCLFRALVQDDPRAGTAAPDDAWISQLLTWSRQVLQQLAVVVDHMGGRSVYLAKGVMVVLSARDREICARFRGDNYYELAREYGLTEMRVRQIVDAWQRTKFRERQGRLPGLDGND
ncbi:Mor transcription activator family protein [Paracidovorax wautersii]|uniref:Mor transcription activator family protein n=1 Tax=Paracidovorax wautersii TaxID=1177982 RepID=UPI0031E20B77